MTLSNPEAKVAYVMIFQGDTDRAVSHLRYLIADRACGFDEGRDYWIENLSSWLKDAGQLSRLNELGASFTSKQWMEILEGTLGRLNEER